MAKQSTLAIFLSIYMTAQWFAMSDVTHSVKFKISPFCLTDSCDMADTKVVRSKIGCSGQCNLAEWCVGFLYPPTGSCSLLGPDCFSSPRCSSNDTSLYQRILSADDCQHNSTLSESKMFCKCVEEWVGLLCERLPYSCDELYQYGYPLGSRPAQIDVYRNNSFIVASSCYSDDRATTTAIFSSTGVHDWDESWDLYLDGFQKGSWDTWLGLKGLLAHNQMGLNDIFFEVNFRELRGIPEFRLQWWCFNFLVKDENHGYSFTSAPCESLRNRTQFSPNMTNYELKDILGMSSGRPFLTPDHDSVQECAGLARRGWWFPDCSNGLKLNPLGYRPMEDKSPEMVLPDVMMNDIEIRDRLVYFGMFFYVSH